jgi:hypothetical protein
MANNFKSDDSFLKKLVIGATGTNITIAYLKELDYFPIELERGSTGYKIWKRIKIKRVRVPDILCLKTGLRFESRGKTKAEISMSHSLNDPNRAWDAGMRDDDYVSIVVIDQNSESPIDVKQISPVHFVCVRDLRNAYQLQQISISKPKGFEEGSEIRVVWPSASANHKSVIKVTEPGRIILQPISDERQQTIILTRNKGKIHLIPQVKEGQTVYSNQIVASVVSIKTAIHDTIRVDEEYYIEKLNSISLSERYAAAKALRYLGYDKAKPILKQRMNDPQENIYVQLEAAAALAVNNDSSGWNFMESKLTRSTLAVPLETQLETIIVLSEIQRPQSEYLLSSILNDNIRDDELRAGAAWALGQFETESSATSLVSAFNSNPLDVKIEAARALLRIAEPQIHYLLELLLNGEEETRDGIAWVLARKGMFNPTDMISINDDNLRKWASYIIGFGKDKFQESDIEKLCMTDPEVYFAASVLWQVLSSWVADVKEY